MRVSQFAMLLAAALSISAAFAQTKKTVRVETVTGQTWEGEVVSDTDKELVLRGTGGQFPIPRAVIKSVTDVVAPPPPAPPSAPKAAVMEAPSVQTIRMHGSNTIGAQLGPDLVTAFGKSLKYTSAHNEAGAQPDESTIVMDTPESNKSLRAEVFAHGSGTAFTDMLAGATDIGMASRPVNAQEAEALRAANMGDMTHQGNENIISLDGITFLVHQSNPLKGMTIAQLHDLMTGVATNWSQVGGPDLPVHIYSRDEKSGTFDLVKEKILGHGGKLAASAKKYESSEDLSDAVAADPSGLGFAGFAYVRNAKPVPIDGACGLPPMEPNVFQVKTEEYPLSRRLFMYVPDKRAPLVDQFLAYAMSPAAAPIAEGAGFVNLEPTLAPAEMTQSELARLGDLKTFNGRDPHVERDQLAGIVKGARRLSITFRFAVGQSGVDSRSSLEFERLRRWTQTEGTNRQITLVGFSSSDGDYGSNVYLSRRRAAEIEAGVRALGVTAVKSVGVGPIEPVACETTPESANLNRRVEVWVK